MKLFFKKIMRLSLRFPIGLCSHITPFSRTPSLVERAFSCSIALQRPWTVTQEFIQSVINPLVSVILPHPLTEDRVCSRYSYEAKAVTVFLVQWEDRIGIYLYWHTFTPFSLSHFLLYLSTSLTVWASCPYCKSYGEEFQFLSSKRSILNVRWSCPMVLR